MPEAYPEPVALDSGKPPKGVLGWLLFLCITLTIIGPSVQFHVAWTAIRNLSHLHAPVATTARLLGVATLYIGLSIFSFWAGVWLWLEDPRGVGFAKAYLITAPVLVIGLDCFFAVRGFKLDLPRIVFGRLVYSTVWFTYLSVSKRVRRTFFEPV